MCDQGGRSIMHDSGRAGTVVADPVQSSHRSYDLHLRPGGRLSALLLELT